MKIGIPRERKIREGRVGLLPDHVEYLVNHGHSVVVEEGAGEGIGFYDEEYKRAGAAITNSLKEVYQADFIVKVKEPVEEEIPLLHEGQTLFCYLHLAASKELTEKLIQSKIVAIAYESVSDKEGGLPLLRPMSEIAGRISVQAGAWGLQYSNGGKGVLLGGCSGVLPARVLIVGGGAAGTEAARVALGMGAFVTVLDINQKRVDFLQKHFEGKVEALLFSEEELKKQLPLCDLLIGAVLLQGKKAPKLLTKEMLRLMTKGSAFVDIAIDQGGIAETSRPTTHKDPFYVEEGIVHYCVTNMPGACPKTSTYALTNVTFPYVVQFASFGVLESLKSNPFLLNGLNVYQGALTYEPVARDHGLHYTPAESLLSY
jgi:alanine dehydrogenase